MQQNVRQRNMSKFWQHQEETEPQPKILLRSKKKKKKERETKQNEAQKTPPFPLLGHKFHFFSVASFALQLLLTAFNLLPFLSCRSSFFFFFFLSDVRFLLPRKWALDNGLGGCNRETWRGCYVFFFHFLVICHYKNTPIETESLLLEDFSLLRVCSD